MNNYNESIEEILKRLEKQMSFVVAKMKQSDKINPEYIFFDNQEFLQIMNISKRTAQNWRNEGIVAFSQIGSKIYYNMTDVKDLLVKNYKKAFKENNKDYSVNI